MCDVILTCPSVQNKLPGPALNTIIYFLWHVPTRMLSNYIDRTSHRIQVQARNFRDGSLTVPLQAELHGVQNCSGEIYKQIGGGGGRINCLMP